MVKKKEVFMNSFCKSLYLVVFLLIPITIYAPGSKDDQKKVINFDEALFNWMRTWAEAMQITKEKHFHIHNPEEDMIKAIDAFISNLDPHSGFLDPKTYKHILE